MSIKNLLLIGIICIFWGFNFQTKTQFVSYSTKNFLIKYEQGISKLQVKSVATDLEVQFKEWTKRLKLMPSKLPIEVRLYNTRKRYLQESQSKLKEDAAYSRGVIFFAPPMNLDEKGERINIISRVVALSILSVAHNNGCPLWLIEAYGIFAGGNLDKFGSHPIVRKTSILDLQEEMNQIKKEKDFVYFYSKLTSIIKFLINRYGSQKIDSLFASFDGSKRLEQVFEDNFGEKFEQIENAWIEFIKQAIPKR